MGRIRALREDDVPDLVALREKTFKHSDRRTSSDLAAYMREMFLSGPWCDEEMPSLVYQSASGRPIGFVGVFPRRMVLGGEEIRVATFTQLMVDIAYRGGPGIELLRHLFRGPQDLSLADAANENARRIAKITGATVALLYSQYWTRPLRPWRHAVPLIGGSGVQRAMRLLARPFTALGDASAARVADSPFRQPKPTSGTAELSTSAMLKHWPCLTAGYRLSSEMDEQTLDFVLNNAAKKSALGILRRVLVKDSAGAPIGWYIYYTKKHEVGEVVDIGAAPNRYEEVLDHLFYDAWDQGLVAIRGRLTPRELPLLMQKQCVLEAGNPWTVVHSNRCDVLESIERGEARLSRLDGEFWMTF